MYDNARYVVVFPPDHAPLVLRCDDGDGMQLKSLQDLVGGPIETIPPYDMVRGFDEPELPTVLIVNEESLAYDLAAPDYIGEGG